MKTFKDKLGHKLEVGMQVKVPEPNETDIHHHEFIGTIADILDTGYLIVEDKESDFFEIEHNRLICECKYCGQICEEECDEAQAGGFDELKHTKRMFDDGAEQQD